jgi:hypothetical protein
MLGTGKGRACTTNLQILSLSRRFSGGDKRRGRLRSTCVFVCKRLSFLALLDIVIAGIKKIDGRVWAEEWLRN